MTRFVCKYDGETFEQRSRYERHLASAHPPSAVSAADLEKALAGIDFPKGKRELVDHASRRVPPNSEVVQVIRALPERTYHDAGGLHDATREDYDMLEKIVRYLHLHSSIIPFRRYFPLGTTARRGQGAIYDGIQREHRSEDIGER